MEYKHKHKCLYKKNRSSVKVLIIGESSFRFHHPNHSNNSKIVHLDNEQIIDDLGIVYLKRREDFDSFDCRCQHCRNHPRRIDWESAGSSSGNTADSHCSNSCRDGSSCSYYRFALISCGDRRYRAARARRGSGRTPRRPTAERTRASWKTSRHSPETMWWRRTAGNQLSFPWQRGTLPEARAGGQRSYPAAIPAHWKSKGDKIFKRQFNSIRSKWIPRLHTISNSSISPGNKQISSLHFSRKSAGEMDQESAEIEYLPIEQQLWEPEGIPQRNTIGGRMSNHISIFSTRRQHSRPRVPHTTSPRPLFPAE
jgi:hypothetical protein